MIEWLHDAQPQWVVDFIRNVVARVSLDILVHGDFSALPAKIPHGLIANARPLLNFTTMWKIISAHIADQYVPLSAQTGVLPCTRSMLPVWRTSFVSYTTSSGSAVFAGNTFVW